MSEGVLGLFGVALGASLVDLLLPGKEGSGIRTGVRLLTAVTVLCLLLSPFLSMLGSVEDVLEGELSLDGEVERATFEECFRDTVNERGIAEGGALIAEHLFEEFGIAHDACEISLEVNEDGMLTCVRVYLSGTALLCDPEEIEAALAEKLSCTVEVR